MTEKITRKEVLKALRKEVYIDSKQTYSEPRKNGQRVKFYDCDTNINRIKHFLDNNNFKDIKVEYFTNGIYNTISVTLFFPNSSYC